MGIVGIFLHGFGALRVSGMALAIATIAALVLRFSIEKFVVEKRRWSMTYIQHYINALIIGITVLVVAIPEGLPLAVTLALAYSVRVSPPRPYVSVYRGADHGGGVGSPDHPENM